MYKEEIESKYSDDEGNHGNHGNIGKEEYVKFEGID